MKKVVLSLAVLFSVALVSCGGKKAEAVDSVAAVEEEVVVAVTDSCACDSCTCDSCTGACDTVVAAAAEVVEAAQ